MRGPWLLLSSLGSWRYSLPRWRLWKTWSRTVCGPFWRRPLGSSRQSQQWSLLSLPRFYGLGPARALLCRRPPLVVLGAPFFSASVGPLGCPSRVVLRPRLTARSPPTAALAPGLRCWPGPSFAPRLLIPVRPPPGRLVEVATLALLRARRRKRDKHRRRNRRHSKFSMWRGVQRQDLACLALWACCADSSSDDDEHNTHTLLLLFADAFTAPALLSHLLELDELMVALSCWFAVDIFTVAQYLPLPAPDLPGSRPRARFLGCESRPRQYSQPSARVDAHPRRLPLTAGLLKGSPQPGRSWLICCLGGSLVLLRAHVGTWDVDAGPRALASVRQRAVRSGSRRATSLSCGDMICATPYIVMWRAKKKAQKARIEGAGCLSLQRAACFRAASFPFWTVLVFFCQ